MPAAPPGPAIEHGTAPDTRIGAVALMLHGGKAESRVPTKPDQLTIRRMRPFARAIESARGDCPVATWVLRYRVRGWNGDEASPVPDADWALDRVRAEHGDVPVVLVGHSLGGRVALRVAGDPSVVAVAALAPWLPDGDPVEQLAGRTVLIAHGLLDTTTSPRASLEYARHASAVTPRIARVEVGRERHAMLWRSRLWHRLVAEFTLGALAAGPMPPLVAHALAGREPAGEGSLRLRV